MCVCILASGQFVGFGMLIFSLHLVSYIVHTTMTAWSTPTDTVRILYFKVGGVLIAATEQSGYPHILNQPRLASTSPTAILNVFTNRFTVDLNCTGFSLMSVLTGFTRTLEVTRVH
jgi:hypothetical protein